MRSAASASSSSEPAKHDPGSTSAKRLFAVTSRRFEHALHEERDLADETVVLVLREHRVDREHVRRVPLRPHRDDADARLVEPQVEERVVELARNARMAQAFAPAFASSSGVSARAACGARIVIVALRAAASTSTVDVLVFDARLGRFASSGASATALNALRFDRGAIASRRCFTASSNFAFGGASSTRSHSTARLPRTPFGDGREHVGEVAADLALVDEAREAAGAREHAEERRLRQAHRARPVVGEDDLVARDRELVAAARRGAVQRSEALHAVVLRAAPRGRGGSRS